MKLLERVLSNRKRIQFVLFLMYVGFMLWMTLFSRTPYPHRVFRPELFWEIRSMLAGEESGKLLTLLGECELDDVISNTFGAFIGVCLYQVAEKCWKDKEKNRVKN